MSLQYTLTERVDDYYLFKDGVISSDPSRISVSALTSDLDLVSKVVAPSYDRSIAELASDISGLKLSFDSNRWSSFS